MAGLFNSTVLDVAIGLAFVYLLLAILCTSANEWIAGLLKARSKMLKEALVQLLDGQKKTEKGGEDDLVREFYQHPLITGMMRGKRHPAYLSSQTFAATVMDIIASGAQAFTTFEDLKTSVDRLPDGDVKTTLSALLRRSGGDLEVAQKAVEGWFDDAMDRVSGWYKRKTQIWTVIIAAVLVILSNADTIQVARRLWSDPVVRAKVVAEAQTRVKKPPPTVEYPDKDEPTDPKVSEGNSVSTEEQQLLTQLIGWQGNPREDSASTWLARILGWLLTILAVSLGAPFWFDLLNKLINIRSAGKAPNEAAKKPVKQDKNKLPPAGSTVEEGAR
jgi:hypothetical protein